MWTISLQYFLMNSFDFLCYSISNIKRNIISLFREILSILDTEIVDLCRFLIVDCRMIFNRTYIFEMFNYVLSTADIWIRSDKVSINFLLQWPTSITVDPNYTRLLLPDNKSGKYVKSPAKTNKRLQLVRKLRNRC